MANPKGNPKNLTPFSKEDHERTVKLAKKGGQKGGPAFRKKQAELRTFKECYKSLLAMTIKELHERGITLDQELESICTDDMTVEQAITSKQITMALFGSHQAYEHIRDQMGQKPIDKQEVTVTEKRPEDMTRGELEEFLKKSTVEEK